MSKLVVKQSGHMSFYVLVLLPFLGTLGVLAVDVTGWNAYRDEVQRTVDQIAFDAAHALPNFVEVEQIVAANARARNIPFELFSVDADSTQVHLTLSLRYRPVMHLPFFDKTYAVRRESYVKLVPNDTVVIISNGHTLRPSVGETAWGKESEWPASAFWDRTSLEPPFFDSRWATQMCFNPAFSYLKFAVISYLDSVASLDDDRVAVIFSPGNKLADLAYARHLNGQVGGYDYDGPIGGFMKQEVGAQSHWLAGLGASADIPGDEACMIFSHPVVDLTRRYGLFGLSATSPICGDKIQLADFSSLSGWLSNCYVAQELQIREAVYWRSAMLPDLSSGFDAEPNIIEAIKSAVNHIVSYRMANDVRKRRGNLASASGARIVVFTDRIILGDGWQSDLSNALDVFGKVGGTLKIFAYSHPWLSISNSSALSVSVEKLEDYFVSHHFQAEIFLVSEMDKLLSEFAMQAISSTKRLILRQ